ncbi:MAG: electron transfer flavoprotein subunit alpha/FixB family protein [Pseudomonadota bacterium]
MKTLVIAEHGHTALKTATRHAVDAARKLGGDVHVLVAGQGCEGAVAQAARVAGVATVLHVDGQHYLDQLPENVAPLAATLAGAYTHVVLAATSAGKNLAPRIAALLDVAQVSDVVAVMGPDLFVSPQYAGNVLATLRSSDRIKVLTVRTSAFTAVEEQAACSIEAVPPGPVSDAVRVVGRQIVQSTRPELGAARVVVSGGRGLGSAEQYEALLAPLADKLNAALGASRAAVDAGYAPNDRQVGQTGQVVAPELYLAVGISGAIQHLAGMKGSRVIVAINKDEEAPIFQVADFGLVGDLFELVPQLATALG